MELQLCFQEQRRWIWIRQTWPEAAGKLPALAQAVAAPLTRAAIFLVATLNSGSENRATLRSFCGDLAALVRAVEFRDLEGGFPASWGLAPTRGTASSGSRGRRNCIPSGRFVPERAMRSPRRATCCSTSAPSAWICASSWPRSLWRVSEMPFRRWTKCKASATSTIAISWASSTGRRIPRGAAVTDAVLIGDEDAAFAGGSYVIVQKYLHDLDAWNALSTEAQERIIGRTKLSDIELDDSVKPTSAHNALTTIVEDGKEIKILRDNMPFGRPGQGEFGTYFIGYSRSPRTIEQMLENMFIGRPPGNYDRLLDFSRAVTGNLFFVPSATFLENVDRRPTCSCGIPLRQRPRTTHSIHLIGARWFARHRFSQRRHTT